MAIPPHTSRDLLLVPWRKCGRSYGTCRSIISVENFCFSIVAVSDASGVKFAPIVTTVPAAVASTCVVCVDALMVIPRSGPSNVSFSLLG